MQQCLLAILVAATLLFTGCGGSGDSTPTGKNTINLTTDGIRPSMLNLISSTDGTLNLTVADPTDGKDPLVAMSKLDGWSLSQPIILEMGSANGNDLAQPAFSTEPGAIQPIYLLKVSYHNGLKVPTGVTGVLMPGTDFSALASGKSLYIIPLKPLAPGSHYSIILTNRLKDSTGQALSASDAYVNARMSTSTATTDLAAKALIGAQEAIAAGVGIAQADLVLTDTFRTTSSGDSLRMLKLAASNIVDNAISSGATTRATHVWSTGDSFGTTALDGIYDINFGTALGSLSQVLTDSSTSPQGAASDSRLTTSNAADLNDAITNAGLAGVAAITQVYKTTVKLPYFLSNTALHPQAPRFMAWRGSSPSLVSIVNGIDAGGDTATAITNALATRGVDATNLRNLFNDSSKKGELATEVIKLEGLNISVPDGNGGTQNLDSERNVTTFNALPALTELVDVPLLLFSAAPLTAVSKVVIFQHGITSSKENVYTIASSIIASGLSTALPQTQNIAVIAIDLPLHGERGFPGILTDSDNPDVYANLGYLATARDNVRQSAADLLGLRAALAFANRKGTLGAPSSLSVGFIGHSLGGIVGTNFVAIANEISDYVGVNNSMFKIDETVLAMAGSQIAHIMERSPTFGPIVSHMVATADPNSDLSIDFGNFDCVDSTGAMCFTTRYLPSLPAATQAEIASTLQQFTFAAQTVLDAADPIGIAGSIAATNPLYFIEVVGNKADNLADQVVPNASGIAGSESLIRELGLDDLTTTVAGPVRHVGRFISGGHSSLLIPDANFDVNGDATGEMQTQVGLFFATNGQLLQIGDPTLICAGTAANCLP